MKPFVSSRGTSSIALALAATFFAGCAAGPESSPPGNSTGGSNRASGGAPGSGGSTSTGGTPGGQSGGSTGTGGAPAATGGTPGGQGGSAPASGGTSGGQGGSTPGTGGTPTTPPDAGGSSDGPGATSNFSFFVVSMKALQTLSGKAEGFGGDLRFGKADGLTGADELCRQAAEMGQPGAGAKKWRALLSATKGPDGMPVHARDRIGKGPWYSRNGQLLAKDLTELFSAVRPPATPALANDMTNERGEPNHYVGATGYTPGKTVDNHDTLTGSTTTGMLISMNANDTCNDWTSTTATGRPMSGHSWPRSPSSGRHWVSDHSVPGCTPGVDVTLGGQGNGRCVGCSGGYGGFFCFAAD